MSARMASGTVAVGDVRNVRQFAVQQSVRLSWPVAEGFYSIYWCEADFRLVAPITGPPPVSRRFVWGSAKPGCRLPSREPHSPNRTSTRGWFLRQEGGVLRPVVDYPARFFLEVEGEWSNGPYPKMRFARLILSGSSVGEFPEPADLACSILGQEECTERIRAQSNAGSTEFRRAACDYLTPPAPCFVRTLKTFYERPL
jgi:hypothetical protein